MKYIIMLGDGMADEPLAELGGKTPLECANTPTMDALAKKSEIGMAHTIPEGMSPGSDTANLAVLGYNPRIYYTGRSPLEALSIGVDMKDTDIAIRCNIVTVSEEDGISYEERTIIDHSSDEISTEDAAILLKAVQEELENDIYKFYVGTSYRHLLIWDGGKVVDLEPPHDHLGSVIGEYLPKDEMLREMMRKSYDILENHPLNVERRKQGLKPANSCWFWGADKKYIGKFFAYCLEKGAKAGRKLAHTAGRRGLFVAMMLFVGIPLPGTGAWTGTLGASFLNMGFKSTVASVCLGVIIAGIIMGIGSSAAFTFIGL